MGESGFSFSRKTSKSFHKDALVPILEEKIKNHHGIFVICRSRIADITFEQIIEELGKTIQHHASIMKAISLEKKYCNGKAKSSVFDKYDVERCFVIEEEGIFERLGLWDKINELIQRKIFISIGSYLIF